MYASIPEFSQYDVWGPNSEEDTKNFIKDAQQKEQKNPQYEFEFAVVLKDSGELIGGCGIRRDWETGSVANLGYAISPDFQSRGYATEITVFLLSFGFNDLGLAVIYATCDTENTASYKVMEKAGMKRVGHVKDHKMMKEKMRDSYCYEAIKPD